MRRLKGGVTIMVIPEEGGESRTLRLSRRASRLVLIAGVAAVIGVAAIVMSWWFLAVEASKGWRQQALVDSLQEERAEIQTLVRQLDRIEAEYDHIRSLFGPAADPVAPDLWLPPTGTPGSGSARSGDLEDPGVPSGWPLTEPGFVTQTLMEGAAGDHPGVDIAVATDSYIRASGAGRVLRTGEDGIYGRFIVLDHGQGYQTVYAHASQILVERGASVRRGEVIGLTGSTGRSTAPHLHFEVLLNGIPVDPMSLVEQPG
ncbi:MAG: peptidoglycan DD-metalloendopeptidase family protein [Longimicrobiales bacterium]